MKWSHLVIFLILMFIFNSLLTHLLNERLVKIRNPKEKSLRSNSSLTQNEKIETNELRKKAKKQYEYINYLLDEPNNIKNPEFLARLFESFKYTQSKLENSLLNQVKKTMIDKSFRFKKKADLYKDLVQKRLLKFQTCQNDKKLICEYAEECDFSCLIHFITMCFVKGYYLNRSVVLAGSGYLSNLEKYFMSLNKSCDNNGLSSFVDIENVKNDSVKVVRMKMNENYFKLNRLHLHNLLYNDLVRYDFVYEPLAWMIGQLLGYIMRNNNETQTLIDKILTANNLQENLFVSVFVPKCESSCDFELKEYMKYVDKFYDDYLTRNPDKENTLERIVYLASNDPNVFVQLPQFNEYKFVTDKNYPIEANQKLNENERIYRSLFNLKLLAKGEHLVCRFSSMECRLAYELKQSLQYVPFKDYDSLDSDYFMSGHGVLYKKAVKNYKPNSRKRNKANTEIELVKNDLLEIDLRDFKDGMMNGNVGNGYIRGKNLRTNETGLFYFNRAEIFHDFKAMDEFNKYNNSKIK